MRDIKKPDAAAHTAEQDLKAQSSHDENSAIPPDCPLLIQPNDLLPGDVLLYRPGAPNLVQKAISSATDSPYTHVAIFLGNGLVADSMFPGGVRKRDLKESLEGSLCVAVLRTQLVFSAVEPLGCSSLSRPSLGTRSSTTRSRRPKSRRQARNTSITSLNLLKKIWQSYPGRGVCQAEFLLFCVRGCLLLLTESGIEGAGRADWRLKKEGETRNGLDWTKRFSAIAGAPSTFPAKRLSMARSS